MGKQTRSLGVALPNWPLSDHSSSLKLAYFRVVSINIVGNVVVKNVDRKNSKIFLLSNVRQKKYDLPDEIRKRTRKKKNTTSP